MRRPKPKPVTVTLSAFQIAFALAGIPLAYIGFLVGPWWLLAPAIGCLSALPLVCLAHWLAQEQTRRRIGWLPVEAHLMPGADGEQVAVVTRLDGSMTTLEVPDDYDPAQDGGQWLVEQLAPEPVEGLRFEER